MKSKAFQKSSIRTVKSTMTRFVSIALISFLGAGILGGLVSVSPNMKRAGDDYYDEDNVMDVRMLSTFGFTEEDVDAIRNVEGVSGVMPTYTVDAAGSVDDKDYTFRINGLSNTQDTSDPDYINQLNLTSGRWPENSNEAIIIEPSIGLKNITLGSTVSLDSASNDSLDDTIDQTDYTIVGIATSSYYMYFMQGDTSVGSGYLDYVLYVPQDNFIVDGYTDLYVTIDGAKAYNTFTDSYSDYVQTTVDRLDTLATTRQTLRYDSLLSELNAAKEEYDTSRADADTQLNDAAQQLADAETSIADAKSQYEDGLTQYNTQKADADSQLAAAKATLDDAAAQIADGEQELSSKQTEFANAQSQLATARETLDNSWSEYNRNYTALEAQKATLADSKTQLDAATAQLTQLYGSDVANQMLADQWSQYNAGAAQIAAAEEQLATAKSQLDEGESEYATQAQQLEAAQTQISQAQTQLDNAKQSYADGLAQYQSQSAQATTSLASAKAQLEEAAAQISDAETQLATKQEEYNEKKADADAQLADAKQQIEDAQTQLDDMGTPKWYVLDRDMNEGYVCYKDDTVRMHDLATVFPIVFFLVAALVCLTTMTRMVDEDRTLIGTFKALGYSNAKIAGRYLKYAVSASLTGSIIGVTFGFWLLPTIIWNAYSIVYALPDMTPAFYIGIAFGSVFATVFIIALSTSIAVKKSLVESPADLMRPKAPKSGKRVFLENIKPIWNRLSFTQKVTVRNLGLNKRRLIMTLIGILGCTALVVTAFGAKSSVDAIMNNQFNDIFHYDLTVNYNDEEPSADLVSHLDNTDYFDGSLKSYQQSALASLTANDDDDSYSIYIVSTDDPEHLSDFITLTDTDSKETLNFDSNSAVITEKLAMNLNIGIGDTLQVKYLDSDDYYTVTVTGITVNYTFNYVYLGEDAYKEIFGETPDYNQFLVVTNDDTHTQDEITTYLSSTEGIGAVSFTDDLMGNITTSIKSINNIIYILIIAAGLLAFVVLYNLTNINIGERQRELATLKVLGFYNKETYSYIFRETSILSVIGCILGLFFGVFLYRAVVATVEPDMILLTRNLTWKGYLGAAILTLLFNWIVNQCMKPRIKKIDMLESLKSVD